MSSHLPAQEIEWPYDDYYTENKMYIHAIANYTFHPYWYEKWENNSYRQNLLRLSFASISLTELLSDAQLAINEKLANGLWFRYATTYYATHHRNAQDKEISIGFEKYLYKWFSLYAYGNPHFEKEEIDISYGASLTNKERTRYIRLAYVDVDPFWNDKNELNSKNMTRPWQIRWETNLQFGRFRFYSLGRYENGYERIFYTTPASTTFNYQSKKIDDMSFKLYYYRNERSFFEIDYSFYNYQESKKYELPTYDFSYRNRIDVYKFGYITPVGDKYRLRCGAYAVVQNASSANYNAHTYNRQEIIPFVFAEMNAGPGFIEAGYMGAKYQWDFTGQPLIDSPWRDDYIDKVKLAYTFSFEDRAYLQFAVSHVTTIWGFGGGNVQFWMEF